MANLSTTAARMHAQSTKHRPATSGNKNVVSSARSAPKPAGKIDSLTGPLKGPGVSGC